MKNTAQTSFTEEIFVDNFAGGGGASTGIETGLGVTIAAAINHDPAPILMHKTNHPYTEHYQASVWDIDPRKVCRGRPVAGAWFSPDCKHFSKAKGAALVDKKIRGLAWISLRWAALVRPRVIFLENVEEFQTWGPVRKGKPIKKLAGTTFQISASRPRLCRRIPRACSGGLRSTYHPETLRVDCPLRRAAHCMAGTDTRAEKQRRSAIRQTASLAFGGRDYRLEFALPVCF